MENVLSGAFGASVSSSCVRIYFVLRNVFLLSHRLLVLNFLAFFAAPFFVNDQLYHLVL